MDGSGPCLLSHGNGPRRFSKPLGIAHVECVQRSAQTERFDGRESFGEHRSVDVEVWPVNAGRERLHKAFRWIGRCSAALRGEGNEASLRRDRQIWMCVEHQPEQSRSGTAYSDDKWRGCHCHSGTTLLRLMLDAHPDLAIPPE